jgi:hypothetical protein
LNQNLIAELIMEINAAAGKKDADSKLFYPDAFLATDYKNWITMNGVDVTDVTDVTRNYTSDEWDKLRQVGGHTYVYQR